MPTDPNQVDEESRIVQHRLEHLKRVGLDEVVGVVQGPKHRLGVGTAPGVAARMEDRLVHPPGYPISMVKNEVTEVPLWPNTVHTASTPEPGQVTVHDPMSPEERAAAREQNTPVGATVLPGVVVPALTSQDIHVPTVDKVGAESARVEEVDVEGLQLQASDEEEEETKPRTKRSGSK